MTTKFDQLAAWSVDHRWAVLMMMTLITVVASIGYWDPHWLLSRLNPPQQPETQVTPPAAEKDASEKRASKPKKAPSRKKATAKKKPRPRPPKVDPFSLSRSDAVIVVDSDDFFAPAGAKAMRQVVADLEALDQVQQIVWMDRVPILNIFGLPEPLFPRSEASPQRFADAREEALNHPLVGGQLLSSDARTTLLLVTFDDAFVMEDSDVTTSLRETAEATATNFPEVDLRFLVTGRIPASIAAIKSHESNQFKYQLIAYLAILVMTIALFRGVRAVLIVTTAPALGLFWSLGMIRYLEYTDNPLIDVILPILVSLVALTDGVHLMVQIRKLRAAGLSEREAAREGVRQVGLACFLTSLTTAIGFGSLTLADSEWVQQFGLCCVIGVALTFLSVVTIIPLLCSTWLGRKVHIGHENSLIDRNLNRVTVVIDAALRRSGLMSAIGIGCTVMLLAISFTMRPDQHRSDGLPEQAEATRGLRHMDRQFGGLEFSEVRVKWSNQVPADSAEILVAITAVDDLLNTEELIGHPLSIRNLIDAQPGSGPPAERMSLLELLPPPLKRAFFTPEKQEAIVKFRVQDLGIARYGPVFKRIESGLKEIQQEHPEFRFDLHGDAVWRWRNLYQIVVDLAASLGTASVIIFLVLALVYRSARIGLISIVPNMFPLALTGAYLALAGYNLEIVMVCCFTVCLGIAAHDPIPFLTRYQEARRESDEAEAIRRAFTGVGTALIMTTTVLVIGFSTVIFSDSRDHRIFATMSVLTIAAALFGDLLFLPALLARFSPDKSPSEPTETRFPQSDVE